MQYITSSPNFAILKPLGYLTSCSTLVCINKWFRDYICSSQTCLLLTHLTNDSIYERNYHFLCFHRTNIHTHIAMLPVLLAHYEAVAGGFPSQRTSNMAFEVLSWLTLTSFWTNNRDCDHFCPHVAEVLQIGKSQFYSYPSESLHWHLSNHTS